MHKTFLALALAAFLLPIGAASAGTFTDNGDSTVTDGLTGLIWQQTHAATTMIWENALAYCEGLTLAGNSDWRLPNFKELESLTDDTRSTSPAIDPGYFPGTPGSDFWSSTTYVGDTIQAWSVHFQYGRAWNKAKTSLFYVRCVR